MAKLNLNFSQAVGRYNPTRSEICQIEVIALGIEAVVKALSAYAEAEHEDGNGVCMGVCNVLELLIDPVIDYLSENAGLKAAPEPDEAQGISA